MMNKILKYDLKAMYKILIPDYVVIILLAVLTRIFCAIKDATNIFSIPYSMILVLFIISLIVVFFHTFFLSIIVFYKNMLGDESYLTHTLPVEKRSLVFSKLISSFITMISSIIALIISVLIAFYTKGMIENITTTLNDIATSSGVDNIGIFYLYLSLALIVGYITYITLFYLSLTIGHTKNVNKIKNSFIAGIIIYIITQIIASIFIFITYLLSSEFRNVFTGNAETAFSAIIPFLFSYMIVQITLIIIGNYITINKLNTNLNIE